MFRKRAISIALILVCLLVVVAVVYQVIGNPLDPFDNRSFSPSRWKVADESGRARMARSAANYIPVGASQAQVVDWLGDAFSTENHAEDAGGNKLPGAYTFAWYLGSWSAYGYDDAYLYVHFDAFGRVTGTQVAGY